MYSLGSWNPIGRADFPMLINKLDSLDDPQSLLNTSPDGQIVDGGRTDDTVGIHDKETTEGNRIVMEDAKGAGHILVEVSDEGKGDGSKAALVTGKLGPGEVRVLGINTDTIDIHANVLEFSKAVIKGSQLGWADKSTINSI